MPRYPTFRPPPPPPPWFSGHTQSVTQASHNSRHSSVGRWRLFYFAKVDLVACNNIWQTHLLGNNNNVSTLSSSRSPVKIQRIRTLPFQESLVNRSTTREWNWRCQYDFANPPRWRGWGRRWCSSQWHDGEGPAALVQQLCGRCQWIHNNNDAQE